jgi:trk system potassium uptake protein TrkA
VRILIVGAGQVGRSIAENLQADHDIVMVDLDDDRVDEMTYSYDVLAVAGDETDIDTLEEAGVVDADMLLAATDDDETNVVACGTVKAVSDAFTVARIKDTKYLRTWQRADGAFGIDFIVPTNLLTAETIAHVVGLPMARDADVFADGQIQMAEFEVDPGSPIAGQTVAEADRFDSLTFAAVLRDGEVEMARGDTRIGGGDRAVVIGSPRSVQSFSRAVAPDASLEAAAEVIVVGGSEIGFHVARLLSERGLSPRLIEQDADRARELAESLPDALVMQSDATDMGFLEREYVGDADVLVSCLDSDEKNLLEALLARELGVERTVAIIEQPSYVELFETVGIDVGISPRATVAEEISRFTRARRAENVAFIETDRAQVIEVRLDADSVLAGRPLRESADDLPEGVVIGAITRGGEFVTPRGDTSPAAGDHVVALARADVAERASKLL